MVSLTWDEYYDPYASNFIGDYEGLHKCLQTANNLKRPWKSVVVSQDRDGDYHLFQTDKHWIKYPSRHEFMASYEIMKT